MIFAADSPDALWYLMRSTGIVSLLLFTAVFAAGIATALNWSLLRTPKFVTQGLHRRLALASLLFLVLHIVTAVADSYVSIDAIDVVVPFAAGFSPIWIGLGTLSVDIALAVVVTSLLRRHIGIKKWRLIHFAAYLCWPLAVVHALTVGTDSRTVWLVTLYIAQIVTVASLIVIRLKQKQPTPTERLVQHTLVKS